MRGRSTRAAWRRALDVDRAGFKPVVAVRAAAAVTVPLAIGVAVGRPVDGAAAAAGALPTGAIGLSGGFRSRATVILAAAIGVSASTFVGGLVAGHTVATAIALGVWGFGAGLAVSLGRDAAVVGVQAVVGLAVFGRFPGSVAASAGHAGLVLAGGLSQGVLAAIFRSPQRYAAERRAIAAAYLALTRQAHDVTAPAAASGAAIQTAADLVARRLGRATRDTDEDLDHLRGLADEAERIRLELQSLAGFAGTAGVNDLTVAAAAWLRQLAQNIRDGATTPDEDPAAGAAARRLQERREQAPPGPAGTPARYVAARGAALVGQLRAVDRLTSSLAGIRRFRLPHVTNTVTVMQLSNRFTGSARRMVATARDIRSPALRHALRLAVMLPVAEIASRALPGQRGYWVTLTVVVVLKPDYADTIVRGLARVVGTGMGVVVAGLILVAVHPSGFAVTALVAVFGWAAYTSFAASFGLYSLLLTSVVVLLLAPTGANSLSTVGDRGLDTLAGGVLALVAYLVWPTWEGMSLDRAVSDLFTALAAYSDAVLTAYIDPAEADAASLTREAASARRARAAAQASLDRAMAEPSHRGRVDTDVAGGILAGARRIVIALHGLRTTVQDAVERESLPEIAPVRRDVVAALHALGASQPADLDHLRMHQQRLEQRALEDPHSLHSRRLGVVAAHLDPLVDSVDTVAHVAQTR